MTTQRPTTRTLLWARFPNQWLSDDRLKFFLGSEERAKSMAALKLLVAILLHAENNSVEKAGRFQGSAALSYRQLATMTGSSREMVSAGIKKLKEGNFVRVETEGQGGRNRYFLFDYGPTDRYAQIPAGKVWGASKGFGEMAFLRALSSRRHADFNALRLYLLLCGMRDRKTGAAKISYEGIFKRSGISEARIWAALSVLYDHRMVRKLQEKSPTEDKKNPPNEYEILGLGQAVHQDMEDVTNLLFG